MFIFPILLKRFNSEDYIILKKVHTKLKTYISKNMQNKLS